MIELGAKAKDKITGFIGFVTGRCEYVSGCHQLLLTPECGEKGEYKEPHWFDEQRVERIEGQVISLDNSASPGFDIPAPVR